MIATNQSGKVVWFTGYSGSGKSTLSRAVAEQIRRRGLMANILDGDELRRGVCSDLGFDVSDRSENVRRIAHIAQLLSRQGSIVLIAVICPLESLRQTVRRIIPDMIQVFVDAPLVICESRDPKGLYRKARDGSLKNFTGVDALFERPEHPDVVCHTDRESIVHSVQSVMTALGLPKTNTTSLCRRPTIAVDFDGVIADYDGWSGEGEFGSPRADVRTTLLQLKSEGWKIVVHTTRDAVTLAPYLCSAGVPFDEINSNSDYPTRGGKPVATVYWDDRAVYYSGNGLDDLKQIRGFRTWCGRP